MTQSNDRSATTGSGFGGAVRRALRTIVLLLLLLLVASIGLVIGRGAPDRAPSAEELALGNASTAAANLAATAAALEETVPVTNGADYAQLTEMFELHSLALQPAGATGSPSSPVSPAGSSTPSPAPTTTAAPIPADLLTDLTASYTQNFEAAATVAPGPARVLASAATAQWLQSRELARRLDASVPEIPVPDVRHDDRAAPACPLETTTLEEPEPGLDGARTAVLAEQRASYSYEVVAARADDPAPFLERMAQHEDAATLGSAVLAQHCVAEPLPAAAYDLDDSLLSETDTALRELENGLAVTYADLVGVSTPGPVRQWALRQLVETAQHLAESSEDASPEDIPGMLPGIDPVEYPQFPQPAS